MEGILHYIWHHRIFPPEELHTTDGRRLEVIDVGTHNLASGPDFFNAKVKIDGVMWAGNVEMHMQASDWFRHGHDKDEAYDNTILHVVAEDDTSVLTRAGNRPAQFVLTVPDSIRERYDELSRTMDYPRCHRLVCGMLPMKIHAWMDALLVERLMQRSEAVIGRVERFQGDWERATFVTTARTFGFGLNGDAFERWAEHVPLQAVGKHRDHLEQVAAIFLGVSGLLERCPSDSGMPELSPDVLQREWRFLSVKFQLSERVPPSLWRHMRIRPQNFPEVRILHLARLFHEDKCSLHRFLELADVSSLSRNLRPCGITEAVSRLLVINAVVPVLYAYGIQHRDEALKEKAIGFLEGLPAEENYIMRQWRSCGLEVSSAADSQALIQLKREYCDRQGCLRCRFGQEFLSV
ncbi:MAG: DUF2851 family protein [Bacteroidaceae bacterium]|nr:DUF2851 family protein [Bacteroidaceae bacterium]